MHSDFAYWFQRGIYFSGGQTIYLRNDLIISSGPVAHTERIPSIEKSAILLYENGVRCLYEMSTNKTT